MASIYDVHKQQWGLRNIRSVLDNYWGQGEQNMQKCRRDAIYEPLNFRVMLVPRGRQAERVLLLSGHIDDYSDAGDAVEEQCHK